MIWKNGPSSIQYLYITVKEIKINIHDLISVENCTSYPILSKLIFDKEQFLLMHFTSGVTIYNTLTCPTFRSDLKCLTGRFSCLNRQQSFVNCFIREFFKIFEGLSFSELSVLCVCHFGTWIILIKLFYW